MRVVMVSSTGAGGHCVYADALLSALAKMPEVSPELVAPADLHADFRTDAYPIQLVLPAYPARNGRGGVSWRLSQVRHLMETERKCLAWLRTQGNVGAVHFQVVTWFTALALSRYRRLGVPLFATIHNIRPHRYLGVVPRGCEDALARWAWRRFDALFVHSESLRDEASKFFGGRHPPIFVTPHGVFDARAAGDAQAAECLGQRKALFFGTIRPNKGLHVALEAMKSLDGIGLTIAGNPSYDAGYWRSAIEPMIAALRQDGKDVEVISEFVPEEAVPALLARHGLMLLPYTEDFHSQSGVLYLAVGARLPVVASDVGGIGDVVRESRIGELVRAGDPKDLARGIEKLLARDHQDLERCLHAAQETYSWDATAKATSDAYEKIASSFTRCPGDTANGRRSR